jgi:hypothetical protein
LIAAPLKLDICACAGPSGANSAIN